MIVAASTGVKEQKVKGDGAMRTLNPVHLEKLMALINSSPYFRRLAMEVRELKPGFSLVEMNVTADIHHNPFGTVHGGTYTSSIDTAAYWSVYCEMDEDAGYTTLDVNVSLLGTFRTGKLIIEGRRVKIGRSICLAEAAIYDQSGRLLAHGNSKVALLQDRQTINNALEAMGHPPLPPKFL